MTEGHKWTARKRSSGRKIRLKVVPKDPKYCLIDAPENDSVVFRGDAIDAPSLCCGQCGAELVVGVDRGRLTNMAIQCKRCGSFNDTR